MKKRKGRVGKQEEFRKYFFWAFIVLLLVLSYSIIKPYLVALISSFILAYLVRPFFVRIEPRIGKSFSAVISILIVILVLIVPMGIIVGGVTQQAYVYLGGEGFGEFLGKISSYSLLERLNVNLSDLSAAGVSLLANLLTSAISYIPSLIIALFITLFGMYYILVSWDELALSLKRYIPFRNKSETAEEISRVTNVIVYGTLLLALVEFLIAGVGFYVIGIEFYLLLAALVFFFAFIPTFGPAFVWIPLEIYLLLTGNYSQAVGVLIVGVILSLVIDSIFRAKLLGKRAKINPVVMLVGILGGISVFGIFGFIIGPLILSYTLEILEEAMKDS